VAPLAAKEALWPKQMAAEPFAVPLIKTFGNELTVTLETAE